MRLVFLFCINMGCYPVYKSLCASSTRRRVASHLFQCLNGPWESSKSLENMHYPTRPKIDQRKAEKALPKYHYRLNRAKKISSGMWSMHLIQLQLMRCEVDYIYFECYLSYILLLRYSRRSRRFLDVRRKGLDGKWAAWANRKYQGHRVLPETLIKDIEEATLGN